MNHEPTEKVTITLELGGEPLAGLKEITAQWWDRKCSHQSALEVEAAGLLNLAIRLELEKLRAGKAASFDRLEGPQ